MRYPSVSPLVSPTTRSLALARLDEPVLAQANREDYWNAYYAGIGRKKSVPSQFAVFVANELPGFDWLIDLGCGSGRDSLFFHQAGYGVLGVDGSDSAIQSCGRLIKESPHQHAPAYFYCEKIDELGLNAGFCEKAAAISKILYSRFFLHAINEAEEDAFIGVCHAIANPGDALALEFRTTEDEHRAKVTPSHYRRYIEPTRLIDKITSARRWKLLYRTEGTGLAKYKDDDAHVCRLLLMAVDKVAQ